MPKVFVTRGITDAGIKLLRQKKYQVVINPEDRVLSMDELKKKVRGVDAILSLLTDKIDGSVMDAAGPQLKIIANYAVGFDNIDLVAAAQRKIWVTNTPSQQVSESVAEHAIALMFALCHRIVEADQYTRAGKYHGWNPLLLTGSDMKGKTIGIVGLGGIGRAIARRLVDGFGVKIVYSDPHRDAEFEKATGAKFRTLPALLKESDFISLHVPLLPSTRHLISTKELKAMKKTAFLINTARGPVVDEKALLKALTSKQIAGAALDVFECEPAIDCDLNDTLELRKLPNVVLTPHTASATIEARQAMSAQAAKNIIAALSGRRPLNAQK